MITRAVRRKALAALEEAERRYWEDHPKEWMDLADRWDGFQWNMARAMVEQRKWEDIHYHLTHNLRETHIKDKILSVLWHSAPPLCQELNLEKPYWY